MRIDTGSDARNAVTTFSIDANVQFNAEMRSTFTVDGGAPGDYAYGPGNLAENQQFMGNRTIMNVIPLGKGTHTIQVWVRISGAPNAAGQLGRFCLVAEGSTGKKE